MKYLPNLRIINVKKLIMQLGVLLIGLFLLINHETLLSLPETEEDEVATIEVPQPKYVDSKQLKCLTMNIFHEAGGEPELGKAAVARVVMNRVKAGFGPNPCSVVYQVIHVMKPNEDTFDEDDMKRVKVCQFSWVCEVKTLPNIHDPKYRESERIAYNVLAYDSYKDVLPRTALFFHALWVDPMWPYKKVAKIGNHIFYAKGPKRPIRKTLVAQNMQDI